MSNTKDFADVIRGKLAADPDLAARVDEATLHAQIAADIFEARQEAKLTQLELAKLAETSQSVIARLEDADYDGHSLKTLGRIARALGKQLRVEFYAKPVFDITAIVPSAPSVEWNFEFEFAPGHQTIGQVT